jgi:predicted protein tyrosine phosphatase
MLINTSDNAALLYVSPLSRIEAVMAHSQARSVISLLSFDTPPPTFKNVDHTRHLRLSMNDISEPLEGYIFPEQSHIMRLLDHVMAWDFKAPLLIHCWAGVSRSTAAAYIALCALQPDACEYALAQELRALSPTATPNPRLIALADEALSRHGHMIQAIERIGRGAECSEGSPFYWDMNAQRPLRNTMQHARQRARYATR